MAQHLPVQAKHHCQLKTTHSKAKNNNISAWLGPHVARRNCSRPPGGIHSPPGASVPPDPLFSRYRLRTHHAARRQTIQGPLALVSSPGAPTRAARRCINSRTPLIFFLNLNQSILLRDSVSKRLNKDSSMERTLWLVSQLSEVSST